MFRSTFKFLALAAVTLTFPLLTASAQDAGAVSNVTSGPIEAGTGTSTVTDPAAGVTGTGTSGTGTAGTGIPETSRSGSDTAAYNGIESNSNLDSSTTPTINSTPPNNRQTKENVTVNGSDSSNQVVAWIGVAALVTLLGLIAYKLNHRANLRARLQSPNS
ncbi:MAG: hypothetical protein JWM11_6342 [Planctomycetaceae bacterium]|nr:hypothetical protein [Planctomycetaceae bacterium]